MSNRALAASSRRDKVGSNLVIRQVEDSDREALFRLLGRLSPSPTVSEDRWKTLLRNLDAFGQEVWVAISEVDQTIVATAMLVSVQRLARAGALRGTIEDVVVDAAWEGRGVGRKLIQHMVERCIEKGMYKVTLCTHQAPGFYASCGFRKQGQEFSLALG